MVRTALDVFLVVASVFVCGFSSRTGASAIDVPDGFVVAPPEKVGFVAWLPTYVPEILFNMQTRRHEEMTYLSRSSGRTMVEPLYDFGKRNWTWFEHGGNFVDNVDTQWAQSVEGIVNDPITRYFDGSRITSKVLPRGMIGHHEFAQQESTHVDLIMRINFGDPNHPANRECAQAAAVSNTTLESGMWYSWKNESMATSVDAFGYTWTSDKLFCFSGDWSKVRRMLRNTREFRSIAFHNYPLYAMGTEWRLVSEWWERPLMRQAFKWREDGILDEARAFIAEHFGTEPFVAVHWRRGDWKNRVDASLAHAALWASSNPRPMVHFVKQKMQQWGVKKVFLATNCGKDDEMAYVREHLPIVQYPATGHWNSSTKEAVVEQAISYLAQNFVGPPCVSPLHVSSFSRHILDQREFDGKGASTVDFCCGEDVESMEVLIYEPSELELKPLGVPIEIIAFSMILIEGSKIAITIDDSGMNECEVGQFYCRYHFNVGPGLHTARANIINGDGSMHPSVATRLFRVRNEQQMLELQAEQEAAAAAVNAVSA